MTTFGLTPDGFVQKTQQDILSDIEAQQLANISPTLDVSADTPLGQLNGIVSRAAAEIWELVATLAGSNDPDHAEGFILTGLCKLSGTEREAATYSTVDCECEITNGTTIESGIHFAAVTDNPDSRWTPLEDFTAPSTGTHVVRFRADITGKTFANAGTITVVATAVVGWTSVNNPLDATGGTDADDDSALRTRREEDLAASGSSTLDALVADIERASQDGGTIIGLQAGTRAFENTTSVTDADGRPPHSFEVILYDGVTPDPGNNDAIAQVIWDSKAGGIRSYGTSSGTAMDANGDAHVVYFSRVNVIAIYLLYDIIVGPDYDGTNADDAIRASVAEQANAKFITPGKTVNALTLKAMPLDQQGVIDVATLTVGLTPSPFSETNLSLSPRDLPRFDTSRIEIFR